VSRNTIGLACLGTGYISSVHAQCASAVDAVQLKALWSRSRQSAKLFAEKHGVPRVYTEHRQLVEDPEVNDVIIGLPTPMHHTAALQAAKAQKHIVCEKPIAMTVGKEGRAAATQVSLTFQQHLSILCLSRVGMAQPHS
jgi:predicted dehydrogenase